MGRAEPPRMMNFRRAPDRSLTPARRAGETWCRYASSIVRSGETITWTLLNEEDGATAQLAKRRQ